MGPLVAVPGLAGPVTVEGTMNGFPFRARVDGKLVVDEALRRAAGGPTATVEITRVGDEPEVRVPADLLEALSPEAAAVWADITPKARRDWVLWISSAKKESTRQARVAKACDMLASGQRRVCCFGGLSWLAREHPECETWAPLPG